MLNFRQPLLFTLGAISAGDDDYNGVPPFMGAVIPQSWQTPYGITDTDVKGTGIPQPLILLLNGLHFSKGGMFHPAKAILPSEGGTLYGITGTDIDDSVKPNPLIFALKGLKGLKGGVFHPLPVPSEIPSPSYQIQGTTKDETGTAIGGYTVYLFNMTTGTPVLVGTTISDGSGLYSFTVDNTQSYWVISYKAGSPDKAGATLNNLTGELP